ncbi:MAG: DUF72 domain-containing protein [Proteobacteria bacterium]|nr:DUF72 domain-containing protein [Pseudomonadota bacterium]MBU4130536.1 DUF72 domain-containing protein [Pseudomonadota bacterium]
MEPARSPDRQQNNNCRIFIGTSGYSYGEWIDSGFYPADTHASNMLARYAQTFGVTELNYTWYQMPRAAAMERMCRRVPQGFLFAAKLTRTLTHEVKQTCWVKEAMLFRQGISPLADGGNLLCILIQLPPYFTRTPAHRTYLAGLLDELSGLPLAVEFRHDSWAKDSVFSELERRHVTLVAVDEPDLPTLFPRLDLVTNPSLFYLRFHGRNSRGWRSGDMQQQFDYTYSDRELEEQAIAIQNQMMPKARKGVIFFNNHVRGQAPQNALSLMSLLGNARP